MLTIDTITTDEQFYAMEAEWNDLAKRCSYHHFFQRHEWHRLWWDHLRGHRRLFVLAARDGRRLVGLAPFVRSRSRFLKAFPARQMEFMTNEHDSHLHRDDLIIPERTEDVLNAIFQHLQRVPGWDLLYLHCRQEGRPASDLVEAVARRFGLRAVDMAAGESPYIPLGTTWAEFDRRLSRKFRSNIRNRARRLAAEGDIRHDVFTGHGDPDAFVERIFAVARKGWAEAEHTGIASTPEHEAFYRRLARVAADNGWSYFHLLSVGGRDIAFAFSLFYEGVVYSLKIGHDPEYQKASPGKVLRYRVLEDAVGRKASEFDMLGHADPFKREWTPHARAHAKWAIFNGGWYPSALSVLRTQVWSRVKPIVRRASD